MQKEKLNKQNLNKLDELNSKIQDIDAELQTHEYLADLNQIENEKAYLNADINK